MKNYVNANSTHKRRITGDETDMVVGYSSLKEAESEGRRLEKYTNFTVGPIEEVVRAPDFALLKGTFRRHDGESITASQAQVIADAVNRLADDMGCHFSWLVEVQQGDVIGRREGHGE